MTEFPGTTVPPTALQDQVPLPDDALFDYLSSGTVETVRDRLKSLEEHDLAALLERLDPRQNRSNPMRQRVVTRRSQASDGEDSDDPGEVGGASTEPVTGQRLSRSVSGSTPNSPAPVCGAVAVEL